MFIVTSLSLSLSLSLPHTAYVPPSPSFVPSSLPKQQKDSGSFLSPDYNGEPYLNPNPTYSPTKFQAAPSSGTHSQHTPPLAHNSSSPKGSPGLRMVTIATAATQATESGSSTSHQSTTKGVIRRTSTDQHPHGAIFNRENGQQPHTESLQGETANL